MRLPTRASRDLGVIYAAGLLRSTGVGLTGVLLGVYLSRAGFSATEIGVVVTAGLAASALGTLVVSLCADRLGRRRTLIGLSLLSAWRFGLRSDQPFLRLSVAELHRHGQWYGYGPRACLLP